MVYFNYLINNDYPFSSPLYGRSLTREECTDVTNVTTIEDLTSTFTGTTENYAAINANTSLTLVNNNTALQISRGSGSNVYIGTTKTFTVTQTGTNHKVSFDITIPTTLDTSVLCKMNGTTVATISTTGSSFQNITLPSALATGSHTIEFVTLGQVSGSGKNFTIDNVKVFYDVTTVQTNCNLSIGGYK